VFVGERRRLDEVLHTGARLPETVVNPVCSSVRMMLERRNRDSGPIGAEPELVPVTPGSLGSWYDEP
jgi:hypothetical protein